MTAASPSAHDAASPVGSPRPPLVLRVAEGEVVLLASDLDLLDRAINFLGVAIERARSGSGPASSDETVTCGVLAELAALKTLLDSPARRFVDPPLEPTRAQNGLLRQALAELGGYHRIDLPPALRELRSLLLRQ
jgi:hypothetical protein